MMTRRTTMMTMTTPHKNKTLKMSRKGNQKETKLQEWKAKLQECAGQSAKTKE
jgi:hypothetical protein